MRTDTKWNHEVSQLIINLQEEDTAEEESDHVVDHAPDILTPEQRTQDLQLWHFQFSKTFVSDSIA